jgi:methyltransferase (TIGR00027 family)
VSGPSPLAAPESGAQSITSVSDTALWVAVYRAMESERPDAHFRDPYARRLAGARGEAIVRALPQGRAMSWPMVVRTCVLDDLIAREVADGADTVINLAAGLDTRPWRMTLPATLRWFDVDLPVILDYKRDVLAGEAPKCRYEARAADLRDGTARRALLTELGAGATRALVVTEGLLIYLEAEQVAELGRDLAATPSVTTWLIDLASPALLQMMEKRRWSPQLRAGNAPFRFAPAEGTAFFAPLGWREAEYRSIWEEAARLKREMAGAWLWRFLGQFASAQQKAAWKRFSGVVRLERG